MIRPRPHGGETAVLALKTHVSSQRTDAMELKNVAGFYTSEVPCHLLVHSACRIKPECLIPQHYFTTLPQTSTLPSTDTKLCSRYMPGLECLSCPEVEMYAGLGAGTTQCPQMPHFTTTMLHSSVVGYIWLAVSNVLTLLFKSQEKLQCPG